MIRIFIGKIRQFKRATMLAPLFMVLEIAAEVAIPFIMAQLIDKGIEQSDMGVIAIYGAALAGLACFALVAGVLSGVICAKASTGFAMNLRNDMFENIQKFSFSNIDKFSSAGLITRLTTDVTNVQNAFQAIIRMAVRSVVMIAAALVMVFRISPELSMIYVFIMPVLAFGLFFTILNVHPIFKRAFKLYDKLNGVISENLHAMRVVKSYVRQDSEKEKFEKISGEIYTDFTKAQKRVVVHGPLIQLCVYTSMLLISWIGAKLVVGGDMTTGEMMSFFTYTMQLLMNLMLMSMVFVMIIIARASAHRVIEVLKETPDIKQPAEPVYEVADGSVCFSNVSFSYVGDPDKLCLFDVNLSVRAGETVGIIGGTGSSKTTLIQLIPRLYDVTCGSVTVGGVDSQNYDIKTLRNAVAVVLQKNTLFSGTVKENLRWGNETATDEEMRRCCELAQADGFIMSMQDGYDTFIEHGGANLSGGQKQRLCIARALLKKPKVLILDDSTSAVDTKTDAQLREAFRTDLPDTTKFIIAQRINSIMDADKIIVMDGGRINGIGTHSELLQNNAIYREVYHSQEQGGGDFDEAAE